MGRVKDKARQGIVALVGSIVLLVGIVAIPYPGPGWLIVFAGLAILATEFIWAQRLLDYAKGKYDAWQQWLKDQPRYIQAIFFLVTAVVVVLTLWLLNAYGILNDFFHLGWNWLDSPLFK